MTKTSKNLPALLPGTELALPEADRARIKTYALNAHSERTRIEYARRWAQYQSWCSGMGRSPLPLVDTVEDRAECLATLATYVTWLAEGRGTGRPLARSTITQALAGIKYYQHGARAGLDYKDPLFQDIVRGVDRSIGAVRSIRRVRPVSAEDLSDMLALMGESLIDRRDAAMLALAWAGAKRRSEIVSLDWQNRGDTPGCRGILTIDKDGCHIQLLSSKTRQGSGGEERYIILRQHVPKSVSAVEAWIRDAGIEPGTPVFREFRRVTRGATSGRPQSGWRGVRWIGRPKGRPWIVRGRDDAYLGYAATVEDAVAMQRASGLKPVGITSVADLVTPRRLTGDAFATRLKARMRQLLRKRHPKMSAAEREVLAGEYSGHSMRAGHITDAAERGVPDHEIALTSGHAPGSPVLSSYKRVADAKARSSLRGVRSGL